MTKVNVRVVVDTGKIDRKLRSLGSQTQEVIKEMVTEAKDDIFSHWSSSSPSVPGNPPAYVSGELERSIQVQKVNQYAYKLAIDAVYSAALEFGYSPRNLKPRPYIRPAFDRIAHRFDDKFKPVFRFR